MHWDAFQKRFENEAIRNSEMASSNSSVYDVSINNKTTTKHITVSGFKAKKIKEKRALYTVYFNL